MPIMGDSSQYLLGRALRNPDEAAAMNIDAIEIIIPMTSLATGIIAGAMDIISNLVLGYNFKILSLDFVTTIVGAGAGATQAFNLEIGTTDLTGGVCTVTLASTDTVGKVTQGTLVTALNSGLAADNISLEKAAGTVFTSGAGFFRLRLQRN